LLPSSLLSLPFPLETWRFRLIRVSRRVSLLSAASLSPCTLHPPLSPTFFSEDDHAPQSLTVCCIIAVCYGRVGILMSMKTVKSWRWLSRKRSAFPDGGVAQGGHGFRRKQLPFMGVLCILMLVIVYRTTNYQYRRAEMEERLHPFGSSKEFTPVRLDSLPRGIIHPRSDLEMRSLWPSTSTSSKVEVPRNRNLLAMAVGIGQKDNVDAIIRKFLPENFTVILFHYDGNLDGWLDIEWSNSSIHIVAQNQTKWWFAKRFLHPDVVSIYDYVFLWDEDLGVKHFHPGRYLDIVRSEGLEISQPALDPNSTGIHHRITVRKKSKTLHRRVYEDRGSLKCSSSSRGPPCTGWVEGMAPVFSRAAWYCAWNLIQSDLVHGWGMDIKLGYCAQGDRTKNVGIVDSEYIVHQGIQTLGGTPIKKASRKQSVKRRVHTSFDMRTAIRRQASVELQIFKERWDKAVKEDKNWVDPYLNWLDTFTRFKRRSVKRSQ
ncbi:hypothetical protein V2J09_019590, partial [Rumex salicifolius]